MNIEDIRKLDKVVDRLAAAGPSGISAPHCWFCGKIEAWFRCDCKDAVEAQQGKRAKPRVVERDGKMLIILDPEVMAREHNQRRKRYEPPARPSVTPVTPKPANLTPVTPQSVTPIAESVTPSEKSVTPSRSPAAERQHRKRERDRAAKENGDGSAS